MKLAAALTALAALGAAAAVPTVTVSRVAEKSCVWKTFSSAELGLEVPVQRCDYGFRVIDFASLHTYAELGGSLPELRLDLHVYAANPAERYAFINMHKVREGDTTAEGVQVKEITREGVVLDYRGTEFVLGHQ